MPAPLNGHAFVPVLLEHLQAATKKGLPLGALVLWGMIRHDMPDAGRPVEVSEKELAQRFGVARRTLGRWLTDLKVQGWLVSESRAGFSSFYRALLSDEKAGGGTTPVSRPLDTDVQGGTTPVSRPLDTDVQGGTTPVSRGVRHPCPEGYDTRVQGGTTPVSRQQLRIKRDERAAQKKRTRRGKGAAPPDPRVKTFIDWFCKAHQTATGTSYVVCGAKDGALIKGLLRKLDGDGRDPLVDLQAAAEAMFADGWGREHASIGVLASQINTWRKKGGQAKAPGAKYAGGF